jgi:hypothetical protein
LQTSKVAGGAEIPQRAETVCGERGRRRAPARKAPLNLGRLRRLVEGLAEWRGAPCIEARLYSTACPACGRKNAGAAKPPRPRDPRAGPLAPGVRRGVEGGHRGESLQ